MTPILLHDVFAYPLFSVIDTLYRLFRITFAAVHVNSGAASFKPPRTSYNRTLACLKKLRMDFWLTWRPHDPSVCPSSIAKYFCDLGFEVIYIYKYLKYLFILFGILQILKYYCFTYLIKHLKWLIIIFTCLKGATTIFTNFLIFLIHAHLTDLCQSNFAIPSSLCVHIYIRARFL